MILEELGSTSMYYLKVEEGEDPLEAVSRAAEKLGLRFAMVHGIGGLERARVGVYHGTGYTPYDVEPMPGHILEVASLTGNVVKGPDKYYPHIHVVLAVRGDKAYAGHLLEARVKPFLELFLITGSSIPDNLPSLFKHRWS
jgi:predicted DNA-binding protein with PD1-like motif